MATILKMKRKKDKLDVYIFKQVRVIFKYKKNKYTLNGKNWIFAFNTKQKSTSKIQHIIQNIDQETSLIIMKLIRLHFTEKKII